MDFVQTAIGNYVATGLVGIAGGAAVMLLHTGIKRLEELVKAKAPAPVATNVNAFLETVDRLAESVVQDANNRMVNALKAGDAFTADVGAAIKQDAISTVMANLGTLKDEAAAVLGPLEPIIGRYIEKHVLAAKQGQTSMNAKPPA